MKESELDHYTTEPPSHELACSIFEGSWSSDVPGIGLGDVPAFNDHRIHWLETQCGGFGGKSILELGPLEGGHTYMMARAGASNILSIESNSKAFLKCLIVQNALKFNAQFMYGDFRPMLAKRERRFDLILASGVLYHMTDPVALLSDMARASDSICIWTHYYDPNLAGTNARMKRHVSPDPTHTRFGDRLVETHRHDYLEFLTNEKFAGGSAPYSQWMTRDSLLGVLEDLGMTAITGTEEFDHEAGAHILVFATRLPGYSENSYLTNNPDVAAAVDAGQFKSGAEHYIRYGKSEGRQI
ncbi:class I SAM-dependent methyltransferase [Paraburkholderia sp. 40]|uniref:class I SAM-dependent methyltransferase n=1 Tax=Paraburkholderia sp. 40 TaxID=2991059 RepID=UPI003D21D26D